MGRAENRLPLRRPYHLRSETRLTVQTVLTLHFRNFKVSFLAILHVLISISVYNLFGHFNISVAVLNDLFFYTLKRLLKPLLNALTSLLQRDLIQTWRDRLTPIDLKIELIDVQWVESAILKGLVKNLAVEIC